MDVRLTIRSAQFGVFSELEVLKFEDWMAGHLKRFFSAKCDALGEACIVETIRYGIKRASQHGFRTRRDVCKYIDLMMVLGRDFDLDPELPWAAAILTGTRWKDTSAKLDQLSRTAVRYQERGGNPS